MEWNSPEPPRSITVRRNPHRSARPTTTNAAPKTSTSHSLSSKNLKIPNFPLDDILSMDIQLNTNPKIPSPNPPNSLNVFLRVRPLPIAPPKSKQIKPSKPSKSCLTINDSQSITISPPIRDNRLKSEVFNGFSHVFSSDSSQDEVYEKLMRPMVEEFLNGRSGLLAALGPSGSGKTHTVFGSAKEPGLVPRALRRIFESDAGKSSLVSRSIYLSVFEIHSEKGKGEKLSDLTPDGSDIYMQQSAVKGLKEILVKDVAQAESLLTHAKSKRATATTNSNSQSSRSQCIINIRCAAEDTEGESEAVLTFVDLAGAEREKKTGNKGGRLLESNFINNTSMVFGLCLRSLLEHQKNPKKPLQKHFKSSLLTRYLRDYLEGRKRMALILTVRSGEEDYFDTSSLLRQASPYMEIKFCDIEETLNLPRNKRRHQIIGNEQKKRVKLTIADGRNDVTVISRDSETFQTKEAKSREILDGNNGIPVSRVDENLLPEVNCTDSNIHRQYYFMQGFSKALWVVLKQYKERVKTMQKDINILTENLRVGDAKYLVMEEELLKLKSQCSCPNQVIGVTSCSMGGLNSEPSFCEEEFTDHGKVVSTDVQGLACLECKEKEILHSSGEKCTLHVCELFGVAAPEEPHECSVSECKTTNLSCEKALHTEGKVDVTLIPKSSENHDLEEESQSGSVTDGLQELQGSRCVNALKVHLGDSSSGPKSILSVDESIDTDFILTSPHKANLSSNELKIFSPHNHQSLMEYQTPHDMSKIDCHESGQRKKCDIQSTDAAACLHRSHVVDLIDQGESCGRDTPNNIDKENAGNGPGSKSRLEKKETSHSKPSKAGRPKRRLMPASSLLLRDTGSIGAIEENIHFRGGKGGQKLVEDEHKRTKGNACLMRLLKNHLPR
ncbi:hypothetical protein SOVF_077930 isoform B [Spinacia oleracea]|uniref:Kinesin-like protein KIN-6 isoform X2 n=1 Tax=Spinacia oleracea TaxID=3562 RepID=A0A9R0J608_SPIOL|nr:kinesin-like protein KIN-6 isoform X2 [Spinacia oleracea]KNA17632.1 hypothetical protein SOVF_077930 isoform B [Spinacia oleracea]